MAEVDLQKKIDAFLVAAYQKSAEHDYNNAVRELKAAEVLDSSNPEILYNLGINYCRLGLFKTAIGYLTKILQLELGFIDALEVKKLLAYAFINVKDYKKSEYYITMVLEQAPTDVVALNLKGYCLEIQEEYPAALQIYETVIRIDKDNYNAFNSISYITAKNSGDLDQSLRYAQTAHASNPANPAYLDTLGYVYLKMRNLDMAEKYLTAAFEKSPLSEEILAHLKELNKLKKK